MPQTGDVLTAGTVPAGITVTGAGTASVSLSGNASAADYQTALRALGFINALPSTPVGIRSIDIAVTDDGSNTGNTATASITVAAAPIVDLNGDDAVAGNAGQGFIARFTPGSVTAVAIADSDADILDVDSTNLSQLAITISNPAPGDELTVDTCTAEHTGYRSRCLVDPDVQAV